MEDEIGERMKVYEREFDNSIPNNRPYIVRLDGHRFSKFTKGFKKPFDERIYNAMVHTTAELVKDFNPSLAYTQSDEITLVFVPQLDPNGEFKNYAYNGRVQKLTSLLSGYCSVRFAYHLSRQTFDTENEQELIEKIHLAYFDGRIFSLPSNEEVLYNIIWRLTDAKRNSKNNLGHIHFAQKEVEGLHPGLILSKLLEKGVDWHQMPPPYKWGVFLKKSQMEKESTNPITGEKVIATRTKVAVSSIDLQYSEENVTLVSQKFSNETPYHNLFVALEEPSYMTVGN